VSIKDAKTCSWASEGSSRRAAGARWGLPRHAAFAVRAGSGTRAVQTCQRGGNEKRISQKIPLLYPLQAENPHIHGKGTSRARWRNARTSPSRYTRGGEMLELFKILSQA